MGKVSIMPPEELHETVEPITEEELKWAKKLAKLLDKCPSDRIDLITIGDRGLTILDKTHPNYTNIDDCNWEGSAIADMTFYNGPNVIGMCG